MSTIASVEDRQRGFDPAVPLPPVTELVDRRTFLPSLAIGRRVVHLGCVDDRLVLKRARSGELLHARLAAVSHELVGVDISAEGLDLLAELVPGQYVHGDVEHLDELDLPPRCDVVIAGEIIEHLGSPHRFLSALCRYLETSGGTAWLTTPNAYDWVNIFRFALRKREHTHPDHRHLYSPATLCRSIELAGLELVSLRAHRWDRRSVRWGSRLRDVADRVVLRANPLLCTGLIVEVRPATVGRVGPT